MEVKKGIIRSVSVHNKDVIVELVIDKHIINMTYYKEEVEELTIKHWQDNYPMYMVKAYDEDGSYEITTMFEVFDSIERIYVMEDLIYNHNIRPHSVESLF